ncbi:MAG: hypothetical protein RIS47_319 [Bacteroidota bacterium]|jgi:hypothetical protein
MKTKSIVGLVLFFLLSNTILAQGILSPSGYGAWGNMIFTAGGGALFSDAQNKRIPDAGAAIGFGTGNPVTGIGVEIVANIVSIKKFDMIPLNLKVHKYLGHGFSMAMGVESFKTIGINNPVSNSLTSLFWVTSVDLHYATQHQLWSRFMFSLGAGHGRFSREGASIAFGAMQFRATDWLAFHTDWSGTDASAGLSLRTKWNNLRMSMFMGAIYLNAPLPQDIDYVASVGLAYNLPDFTQKDKPIVNFDNPQIRIQEKEIAQLREMSQAKDKMYLDVLSRLEYLELKEKGEESVIEVLSPTDVHEIVDLSEDQIVKVFDGQVQDEKLLAGYYLVLYAYKGRNNTVKAVNRFKYLGVEANVAFNKKDEIYYIYLKQFANQADAISARNDFEKRGFNKVWVMFYK